MVSTTGVCAEDRGLYRRFNASFTVALLYILRDKILSG